MSIRQFYSTLHAASEEARSFEQLCELGVDDLRHTGRNWEPWART